MDLNKIIEIITSSNSGFLSSKRIIAIFFAIIGTILAFKGYDAKIIVIFVGAVVSILGLTATTKS